MKKVTLLLGAFIALFFISCEGPAGPPGFDGFDGQDGQDGLDGVNILGTVIDIEGDFNPIDYEITYEFPQTVEVFETDVVLVYILWEQLDGGSEPPIDVWRLLPQTVLLNQGILQYNYDHSFLDVRIFLDADFDLGTLTAADTQDQVFRIAILPAEKLAGSKLDKSNINAVMRTMGVEEKDVQRFKLN
ncbi:collagen-like protein [Arenibacter sp. BSSL-BM3]|uniref:Collagen-like protein n=1 Tax=Arenibacter arenosicollis TaxID=2762274 RepID=A0ABR7QNF6_9FLAO|nr:collagen-like protein [Arenibacter arenosicollis]MBC8768744.1 collagen-like protein [Arenibacter arenosicollis]